MYKKGLIQQTLEEFKGTTTMVIIAHRFSTLLQCDRIVGMETAECASSTPRRPLEGDNAYYMKAVELSRQT